MAGGGGQFWDEPMNEALFAADLDAQFMSSQLSGSDRLLFHVNVVKREILSFINSKRRGPWFYDTFFSGGWIIWQIMPKGFLNICP